MINKEKMKKMKENREIRITVFKNVQVLTQALRSWTFLILVTFQIGTCYAPRECREKNGTGAGECAQGYGVCCVCKLFPIFIVLNQPVRDIKKTKPPIHHFTNLKCCKMSFKAFRMKKKG